MPPVLITRPLLPAGLDCFVRRGLQPESIDGISPQALKTAARSYPALVTMVSDRCDAAFFAHAAGGPLRIVANHAAGFDNLDTDAARRAGIWVTNTPDVLSEATAEMAWTLALAASRRLGEGERLVRAGQWSGWQPTQLLGQGVVGKTVGILGAGRIGQTFARLGQGFRVRILYHSRHPKPDFEQETGARFVPLAELLQQSDIVSLHLPATPQTYHLIAAPQLALMKPTAILVNTGRGNAIDEAALAEALHQKRLGAAGLDVYEREPVIEPALLALPNVVLLPHLGSATEETRTAMAERCAVNIAAALRGERPPDAL